MEERGASAVDSVGKQGGRRYEKIGLPKGSNRVFHILRMGK